MGKGAFPASHPLNLGPVGMHGSKFANLALTESDLIVAAGARFSDRVTGKLSEFAPHADVVHIDIDPAEIGKVREAQVPIVGDVKGVLGNIVAALEKAGAKAQTGPWLEQVAQWRARYPFYHPNVGDRPDEIVPELVMRELSERLDPHASVVVTEVGQHQMWAAQHIAREEPRTFLSSGGLGTMGFGFPAAIGAAIGRPDAQVVCVAGDGSLQMNSQEMATAAVNGVPVKVLVMDNRCLGMVRQWQKLFYRERYSATLLDAVPDFVKLADAYGWRAERVERPEEVVPALERMLAAEGPYLLDVAIDRDQNVYPMVAPGSALPDALGAIDVAVGAVRTDAPPRARCGGHGALALREGGRPVGGRWKSDPDDTAPRVEKRATAWKGAVMRHVLSVLVENKPGVLSRVTGLISRRGFNIESLSVGPTEDATMSRVTAIVRADDVAYEQITKQLHKLISVYKITDLTNDRAIERELALFKVNATPERRSEIIEIANISVRRSWTWGAARSPSRPRATRRSSRAWRTCCAPTASRRSCARKDSHVPQLQGGVRAHPRADARRGGGLRVRRAPLVARGTQGAGAACRVRARRHAACAGGGAPGGRARHAPRAACAPRKKQQVRPVKIEARC